MPSPALCDAPSEEHASQHYGPALLPFRLSTERGQAGAKTPTPTATALPSMMQTFGPGFHLSREPAARRQSKQRRKRKADLSVSSWDAAARTLKKPNG